MPKLTLKPLIAIVLCLALGTIGVFYYRYQAYHPSTDDAYIQAHVIHIAPQVDGRVKRVLIKNHQTVKAGQLLLEIDPRPFNIALNKAKANLVNFGPTTPSKTINRLMHLWPNIGTISIPLPNTILTSQFKENSLICAGGSMKRSDTAAKTASQQTPRCLGQKP